MSWNKGSARRYAFAAKVKGKLTPQPCSWCGNERAHMHHEDYQRPLDVTWLCRLCHGALHRCRAEMARRNRSLQVTGSPHADH